MDRAQVDYLEQLVKHPGWLLFKEYARKQWGPEGYGRRMREAITSTDPALAGVQVVSTDRASTEINALLSWPEDQVKQAQPVKAPEFSLQRGGA